MDKQFSNRAPALVALALSLGVAVGAYADARKPTEQMAVAEAAVRHASTQETNANAAPELRVATAKLADARLAMSNKDYGRAGRLAEQVELDARVAELHAQAGRLRKAAQDSQDGALDLRDEIDRNSPH